MDPSWAPCGSCQCVNGDAGYDRWQLGDGDEFKSRFCPRQQITTESMHWIRLYHFYKAGHLVVSGGVLDQPAIYLTAMFVIDAAYREATEK